MNLTEELNKVKTDFATQVPAETLEANSQAMNELERTGITNNSSKKGDLAPAFTLPNVQGEDISSSELLAKGPLVVSFYRGVW